MTTNTPQVALSAQLIELTGQAHREVRLLPAGSFRAKDGRPQGLPGWHLDFLGARNLIDAAARQTDRYLIDYDHQTLHQKANGNKAPAAGWFSALEWREGDRAGLYATDVEWTAAAKNAIESKEYRYLSPVLSYNPETGAVTGLLMAALVNFPALDGLTDLAAAHFHLHEDSQMPHATLSGLLGLPTDASANAVNEALSALIPDGQTLPALLKSKTDEIAILKAKLAEPPDPAKYAPLETLAALQGELATLRQQVLTAELQQLLEPALAEGRLLPVQKEWAEALGRKDIGALRDYLATLPKITALSGMQTQGIAPPQPPNTTIDTQAIYAARRI